jgi:hypothetical protein
MQDRDRIFREVLNALMPGRKLLVVEVKMHLTGGEFLATGTPCRM